MLASSWRVGAPSYGNPGSASEFSSGGSMIYQTGESNRKTKHKRKLMKKAPFRSSPFKSLFLEITIYTRLYRVRVCDFLTFLLNYLPPAIVFVHRGFCLSTMPWADRTPQKADPPPPPITGRTIG